MGRGRGREEVAQEHRQLSEHHWDTGLGETELSLSPNLPSAVTINKAPHSVSLNLCFPIYPSWIKSFGMDQIPLVCLALY